MAATNPIFSPQVEGVPFVQRIANFWRWWKIALSSIAPSWLLSILSPPAELANIYLDGRSISTLKLGINSATPINTVSIDEGDAALRRLVAALRAEGGNLNALRLVLPPANVLRRRISLPIATEENLRQVVGFDLDRQTPFSAASAFYDVKIEQRDTTSGMLTAQLAATAKAEIESVIALLAKGGMTVRAIGVVDDLAGTNPHFDLFPPELRPLQKLTARQIFNRILMVVVALLVLAVVFIPVWQKRENVISLLPILEKAKVENEGTERVLTEVTRLATEYNFIATKKQTTQATVTLVEEFSKMLPDNTWVQVLEIKTTPKVREVQVQGEAASATKLIELFEKSPLLQNTSTRSQVSRGAMPNTERFHIAAEVKPRLIMDEKTAMAQGALPMPAVGVVVPVTGAAADIKVTERATTATSGKDAKTPPVANLLQPAKEVVKDIGKEVAKTKVESGKIGAPDAANTPKGFAVSSPKTAPLSSVSAPTSAAPLAVPVATPLPSSSVSGRPVPAIGAAATPTPAPAPAPIPAPPDPSSAPRGVR